MNEAHRLSGPVIEAHRLSDTVIEADIYVSSQILSAVSSEVLAGVARLHGGVHGIGPVECGHTLTTKHTAHLTQLC